MSIQLTITFGALLALVGMLTLLVLPLPTRVTATVVQTAQKALQNKQANVVLLVFTAMTVLSLGDSIRVGILQGKEDIVEFSASGATSWDNKAKKFYAQRNMYIYGSILFCEAALVFLSWLVCSLDKNKQKLAPLASSSSGAGQLSELEQQLAAKKADLDQLKTQYASNAAAYDAAQSSKAEAASTEEKKTQ